MPLSVSLRCCRSTRTSCLGYTQSTCVTGDTRHRRTIYEVDQDFERFSKTLIANFKDTTTLWEFLRASLRQYQIHKLSKVGKDKDAWTKSDEYLTNLMDSDTVLTLENTDEAIKNAQNYMQRQDNNGEKHVAFSSASDESNDGEEEVKALRASLKEKDQRLAALEAKFDSFSNEQKDSSNKPKKLTRKNEKECTYCKKAGKWFQGHEESECHHKKKDEAEAALQAIKERRERTGKRPKRLRVRRKPSRLVLLLIKDQPQLRRRLVVTSIQRVYLCPHPMLSPFQQQRFLTSAASATAPSTLPRSCTCAEAHTAKGSPSC
jgi:hypothetical protein